ncbi:MAG: sulfotransferase [Verrucomicrobiaceae bacterium]|nr:sulfotransferase [Verrucomicrobiaceae bacterium]
MALSSWLTDPILLHPLAGASWGHFWQEYRENKPYSLRSLPSRLCSITSMIMNMPSAWLEERLYGRAVQEHVLSAPPVFIIGHARSGTTHLHNLLSLDPRFAFINLLQTMQPRRFLTMTGLERAIIRAALPKTRGIDNVVLTIDSPQEEEMALGILSGICAYKCFFFPDRTEHHFRESMLMENVPADRLRGFKEAYVHLVKKISYASGPGRQILFKSPANTTRIPLLLELFPDARFIHIVRNPHKVYHSMQRLIDGAASFSWHARRPGDFEDTILGYEHTMRRYLEDREKVPAGHLIEVRYEDLDRAPVDTIASIYDALQFPGREDACARVAEHCAKLAGYQKNCHPDDPALRARVAERWRFAFEAFGYPA